MEQLIAALKIVHANTFVMYYKSHSYHWNVEGCCFPQYHSFFGDLYEETYDAVDVLAETIRALGAYAPFSIMSTLHSATVSEDAVKPGTHDEMINNLIVANTEVLTSLQKAFELANQAKQQGVANVLADRIQAHDKHGWMLKSSVRKVGEHV